MLEEHVDKTLRWKDWIKYVEQLTGEQGISVFPYLWSKQGKNIENCHKEPIPMLELWFIHNEVKS